MKTFISICLLALTLEAFSQKIEFESYGLIPSYTKGRVIPCDSKLTIEKSESSKYKIIAIDPSTHKIFFNATVSFNKYIDWAKAYTYNGTVIFENKDRFNCTIETNITKLSEFINDEKCNSSRFAFEIEYKITLYYWGIGSSELSQKSISFYPICNEDAARKKREEISSNIYSLKEYAPYKYEKAIQQIQAGLLKAFVDREKQHIVYNPNRLAPHFEHIAFNRVENHYHFRNTYKAYFKRESLHSKEYSRQFVLIQGEDHKCENFKKILWYNYYPVIEVEGYDVISDFTIDTIHIDYYKGIAQFKLKKGNIVIKGMPPNTVVRNFLLEEFRNKYDGRYTVCYEYGTIMGIEIRNICIIESLNYFRNNQKSPCFQ